MNKIKFLLKRPICFIWGHKYKETNNFCNNCGGVFTEYSWTGLELKERMYRFYYIFKKKPF